MKKQELTPKQKFLLAKVKAMKKFYEEIEEKEQMEKNNEYFTDFKDSFSVEEEINIEKELKKIC